MTEESLVSSMARLLRKRAKRLRRQARAHDRAAKALVSEAELDPKKWMKGELWLWVRRMIDEPVGGAYSDNLEMLIENAEARKKKE
jgi:hypothetical protein